MCNYAVAYPEPKEAAMPEDHAVRRDVTVPAEPEEVWEAFATEEGLEGWLADDVELDLRDGGEAVLRYPDGEERRALVERVEQGRRIVLRWRRRGCDPSRVLIELEPVPAGTLVRVVEWGLGPTASARAWREPLEALAAWAAPWDRAVPVAGGAVGPEARGPALVVGTRA
jgi:uncharacterized protein YndB with AHSA1/START domain